jgi:hypothetical protein
LNCWSVNSAALAATTNTRCPTSRTTSTTRRRLQRSTLVCAQSGACQLIATSPSMTVTTKKERGAKNQRSDPTALVPSSLEEWCELREISSADVVQMNGLGSRSIPRPSCGCPSRGLALNGDVSCAADRRRGTRASVRHAERRQASDGDLRRALGVRQLGQPPGA